MQEWGKELSKPEGSGHHKITEQLTWDHGGITELLNKEHAGGGPYTFVANTQLGLHVGFVRVGLGGGLQSGCKLNE